MQTQATPSNPPSSPFAQHTSDVCENCEQPVLYSASMSSGSHWVHADSFQVRCATQAVTA